MSRPELYDAVVVGGGPAGLLGALYLARFRRTTLLLDGNQSRVQRIPRSHNYPGFGEGITGPELLGSLREQVEHYAVERLAVQVSALSAGDNGFRVEWAKGEARARCVLLATGATDIEPDMPYAAEALRTGSLRYCPVCDGYEVIDQDIGVLTNGSNGVREALYLRHFSKRVRVFLAHAGVVLSPADMNELAAASIGVADGAVNSLRFGKGRVTVGHGDLTTTCDTVYCALGMRIHSDLALGVGATVDSSGYLEIDAHQQTSVAGLYSAGDVASGLNQISVAFGGAAIAASAIHRALIAR